MSRKRNNCRPGPGTTAGLRCRTRVENRESGASAEIGTVEAQVASRSTPHFPRDAATQRMSRGAGCHGTTASGTT
jgi:hypothetical protein